MKIAISGKGGVGKTTVTAFIIEALLQKGRKVLAVDADPSPHLARVLGFDADAMMPISRMRELLDERSERNGPFYRLNPRVDDIPERFMLKKGNLSLMVLGAINQAGAGCACSDNVVLKAILSRLLLSPEEDVVLDMEAGVEHLGRGTIASVDYLIVVVQPYLGSMETARQILTLASELGIRNLHVVANNINTEDDLEFIEKSLGKRPVASFAFSNEVKSAERKGSLPGQSDKELLAVASALIKTFEKKE